MFVHINDAGISLQEKTTAINNAINLLAHLLQEFEERGGIVTINYEIDGEDKYSFSVTIDNEYGDFMVKLNDQIQSKRGY